MTPKFSVLFFFKFLLVGSSSFLILYNVKTLFCFCIRHINDQKCNVLHTKKIKIGTQIVDW